MNLDPSLGDKAVVVRASACIGSAIAEKLGAAGAQIFFAGRTPRGDGQVKDTDRNPASEAARSVERDRMHPLGNLIPWIAATSILGVLGVTLLERLVPILPSTALLVAMGVAVAEGHWSLPIAFWSSTAGSLLGCLSFYGLGLALGETRSIAILKRSAWFLGVSQAQLGRLIIFFRRHERTLVFGSQLIPSVRLIAPGIAGLLHAKPGAFLAATTLGVALWNSLLIGVGYSAAALADKSTNASAVAAKVVFILLVGEGLAAAAWRGIVAWRGTSDRHGDTAGTDEGEICRQERSWRIGSLREAGTRDRGLCSHARCLNWIWK